MLQGRSAVREIHPHVAVAPLAREAARVDAVALKLGIRRDRGNLSALPRVRVKSPAVVRTFDRLPIAVARRERKRAVRADVAQREDFPRSVAPQNERNFKPRGSRQRAPANLVAAQGRIPKAPQQFAVDARGGHTRD